MENEQKRNPGVFNFEGWMSLPRRRKTRTDQLLDAFESRYNSLDDIVEPWWYEKEVDNWTQRRTDNSVGRSQEQMPRSDRVDWPVIQESLEKRHRKLGLFQRELRCLWRTLAIETATQRAAAEETMELIREIRETRRRHALEMAERAEVMGEREKKKIEREEAMAERMAERPPIQVPTPMWRFDGRPVHPHELRALSSKMLVTFKIPSLETVLEEEAKEKAVTELLERLRAESEASLDGGVVDPNAVDHGVL